MTKQHTHTQQKDKVGQRMMWLDSFFDSMDVILSKLPEMEKERKGRMACYSPWGCTESDMT